MVSGKILSAIQPLSFQTMIEQKYFVPQFSGLPITSCQLSSIIQLLPTGDGEGRPLQSYDLLLMLCHKVAEENAFYHLLHT